MTDYIPEQVFEDVLRFLRRPNAVVLRVMMRYGMRIGDALAQRRADWLAVWNGQAESVVYVEEKTGKLREFRPDAESFGWIWSLPQVESEGLFPGRDPQKHRTRQAVWKDLHQVAQLYRVDGKRLCRRLGTHTARKIYAVARYRHAQAQGVDDPLDVVRQDLNHSDRAVTFLYALADLITKSRVGEKM